LYCSSKQLKTCTAQYLFDAISDNTKITEF
jgi:hypothetical protein